MPHIIVEYTDNLKGQTDLQAFLQKINETMIAQGGVFPTGGIRSRAYELNHYQIADGKEEDAFVHLHLKIGKGRTEEEKQRVSENLFQVMKEHFSDFMEHHYLALSLELTEFQHKTYKVNNIHQRFR